MLHIIYILIEIVGGRKVSIEQSMKYNVISTCLWHVPHDLEGY
jgi:hypothetical protein